MSNLLKNLLLALGLAVLLMVGYMAFMRGEDPLITSSAGSEIDSAQAQIEVQQLLATTRLLDSFDINGDIFKDARFVSLFDHRIALVPEPVGRVNPFAPVE